MRKYIAVIVVLWCAGLFCIAQAPSRIGMRAYAQLMTETGAGLGKLGGGSSYTGPFDLSGWSSAAIEFGSCARAATAAYATGIGALCDLVDTATGLITYTLHTLSTGFANVAGALGSSACAVACSIAKVYGQIGGNSFTQGTLSQMPTLSFNALGGLPCIAFNSGNSQLLLATTITPSAQPVAAFSVVNHTSGAINAIWYATGVSTQLVHFFNNPNYATYAGGSNVTFTTLSDNANHALQTVNSDPSNTAAYADGSTLSQSGGPAGTAGFGGTNVYYGASNLGSFPFNGNICEMGWASLNMSSTQANTMNSNQHSSSYGYNF